MYWYVRTPHICHWIQFEIPMSRAESYFIFIKFMTTIIFSLIAPEKFTRCTLSRVDWKSILKGNFYRAEVLIKSYRFYCGRMILNVVNAAMHFDAQQKFPFKAEKLKEEKKWTWIFRKFIERTMKENWMFSWNFLQQNRKQTDLNCFLQHEKVIKERV